MNETGATSTSMMWVDTLGASQTEICRTYEVARVQANRGPKSVNSNSNYDEIIAEVVSLLSEEPVEGYGVFKAERYAFTRSFHLLTEAKSRVQNTWPRGSASTSIDGWVRIEWIHNGRIVRLMVPGVAGSREYVYHQENNDYGAVEQVTPEILAMWLDWLYEK